MKTETHMRRVVVTGLGAITPVGKDINSFWDSLTAGKHGIAPITRFDTTDYKAKLAAEVKDFSPADYYMIFMFLTAPSYRPRELHVSSPFGFHNQFP